MRGLPTKEESHVQDEDGEVHYKFALDDADRTRYEIYANRNIKKRWLNKIAKIDVRAAQARDINDKIKIDNWIKKELPVLTSYRGGRETEGEVIEKIEREIRFTISAHF